MYNIIDDKFAASSFSYLLKRSLLRHKEYTNS